MTVTNVYNPLGISSYPLPLHICTPGRFNLTPALLSAFVLQAQWSAASITANRAIYSPISIPAPFTVARFMVPTGTAAGNVDVGLYSAAGVRLISTGTTVRAGTAAIQYIDVTDQAFPAGRYYLAIVISGGTVYNTLADEQYQLRMCGYLQEALGSALLPATMTPASYAPIGNLYCYGFSQSDTL